MTNVRNRMLLYCYPSSSDKAMFLLELKTLTDSDTLSLNWKETPRIRSILFTSNGNASHDFRLERLLTQDN